MAIQKVGIVGGGKMSAEIFKLLIDKDFEVVLWARRPEVVAELDEDLKRKLRRRAKKGGDEGAKAEARLAQLTITTDLDALADVDLITENLTEKLSVKREIFALLDRIVKPSAIFTTNTSSLSPSSIAVVTSRPERFLGLHFFFPMSLLSFVEVAPGARTLPGVAAEVRDFVIACGKRPIVVKEVSGYLVNRMLLGYYNEGAGIVSEGHWLPGQVDKVAKRFAMMGPCETVDMIGIDVLMNGFESADESWGEKDHVQNQARGKKNWPTVDFALRDDGRLGLKTGLGFYRYENGRPVEDPEWFKRVTPTLSDYHMYPAADEATLEKRLFYSIVLEAILALDRGLGTREEIDLVLKEILGLEKPPFAFVESEGVEKIRATVTELAKTFGPRFDPIGILKG